MANERSAYDSYDEFLREAIKLYWERGGNKATFLALLLATREAWSVAVDKTFSRDAGVKLIRGAAGVAGITVLLRLFLGGPIGILLTGASVVSLVGVYIKNHEKIWAKQERIRALVKAYRDEHGKVLDTCDAGSVDQSQRELMVDGLISRFLGDLDDGPEDKPKVKPKEGPPSDSFAAHIQKQSKVDD